MEIVERVNGILCVFVVLVVWILLWCVYMLYKFIGVSVIGIDNFLLNSVVFRFKLDMFFRICWCSVIFDKFFMLWCSVYLEYVLLFI